MTTAYVQDSSRVLHTTAGDFPLHEYHLRLGGRAWSLLHTGAVLSRRDEVRYLEDAAGGLPYGVALWPAAIALAHELEARAAELAGARLLELGSGTGLPGIVAATLGARVRQTDRQRLALTLCRRNAERNGAGHIDCAEADWTRWDDAVRYDLIVGSDVLYARGLHSSLTAIFLRNLAPGGRVLLADPFRATSLELLERLEADGWRVSFNRWNVSAGGDPRPVGVFELAPPS